MPCVKHCVDYFTSLLIQFPSIISCLVLLSHQPEQIEMVWPFRQSDWDGIRQTPQGYCYYRTVIARVFTCRRSCPGGSREYQLCLCRLGKWSVCVYIYIYGLYKLVSWTQCKYFTLNRNHWHISKGEFACSKSFHLHPNERCDYCISTSFWHIWWVTMMVKDVLLLQVDHHDKCDLCHSPVGLSSVIYSLLLTTHTHTHNSGDAQWSI